MSRELRFGGFSAQYYGENAESFKAELKKNYPTQKYFLPIFVAQLINNSISRTKSLPLLLASNAENHSKQNNRDNVSEGLIENRSSEDSSLYPPLNFFTTIQIDGLGDNASLIINNEYKLEVIIVAQPAAILTKDQNPFTYLILDEITISVRSTGINVKPKWFKKNVLRTSETSELIEFILHPQKICKTKIQIELYRQNHWLGQAEIEVDVIAKISDS